MHLKRRPAQPQRLWLPQEALSGADGGNRLPRGRGTDFLVLFADGTPPGLT
jgi:hypothetical protein